MTSLSPCPQFSKDCVEDVFLCVEKALKVILIVMGVTRDVIWIQDIQYCFKIKNVPGCLLLLQILRRMQHAGGDREGIVTLHAGKFRMFPFFLSSR